MDMNERDNNFEETAAENTEDSFGTLDVDSEDIDSEMLRYGAVSEESYTETEDSVQEPEKKKSFIQKPVIIAAIALVVTAVVVFASMFIYKAFFMPGIDGTWMISGAEDSGVYFVFDKDGNVSMDGGGVKYFGTYTMENVDGVNTLTSEFYYLAAYGGKATVTFGEDKKSMELAFDYGTIPFVKAELPKLEVDPTVITHASADELGITSFTVNNEILGSWTEAEYGTYTFNEDGTGEYYSEYSYSEYYGYGLGVEYKFKYFVHEDEILFTLNYYNDTTEDAVLVYYPDNGKLVLNGVGYAPVK